MVFYNDDLTLYTKTSINSVKVDEIEDNPHAYILLGYNETTNNSFVEIDAQIEVVKDQKVIDWLWETQDKTFFDSKQDPELCVLKVIPKSIKLMNDDELDTLSQLKFNILKIPERTMTLICSSPIFIEFLFVRNSVYCGPYQ